jgi:hypothetical protein
MRGKCFIEPLFHEVVSGSITQFRGIIKPQPKEGIFPDVNGFFELKKDEQFKQFVPRYKPGEKLYLKEPYRVTSDLGDILMDIKLLGRPVPSVEYKYDNIYSENDWQNKLFMPARFARYFIEITGVRAERLQDISDEDCIKEGITYWAGKFLNMASLGPTNDFIDYNTPREAYAALIDSINGRGTWESNPFVWIYDFKLTNIN